MFHVSKHKSIPVYHAIEQLGKAGFVGLLSVVMYTQHVCLKFLSVQKY
jgi:hypothetical protein